MEMAGAVRIGELSRRSGVSPELLRAWERRYGLLQPTRSAGGLRLYSPDDLARVQAMQRHLADGYAAAARDELAAALASFDDGSVHAAFDALLARLSVDALLRDVIVPYLHELGERWERGEVSIAQEHFASTLLRGRLLAFGIALRARGWRIIYLGTDTPIASVADAARSCNPAAAVVSAVDPRIFRRHAEELQQLALNTRLCLGGAGAAKARLDADLLQLTGDPIHEAERLTELAQSDPQRLIAGRAELPRPRKTRR